MTKIQLLAIEDTDVANFKADIQESFQKGFEAYFGESKETILPEKDIDSTLQAKGAIAYKAIFDGKVLGGAVVTIDEETKHNHLSLLFVKYEAQGKGVGKAIWFNIEQLHPETAIWETCTPYFEKRNIHFYVNVCGFSIVKYLGKYHGSEDMPEDFVGDGGEGMFVFQKTM